MLTYKLLGCCSFLQFAGTQQLQALMDIPVDVLRPLYDEMDRQISTFDQVCLPVQRNSSSMLEAMLDFSPLYRP